MIAPADAEAHDTGQAAFRRLVRQGLLRRLRRGVYVDRDLWDAVSGDVTAWHLLQCAAMLRTLPAVAGLTSVSALAAYRAPLPRRALPSPVCLWRPQGQDHRGGHDARSAVFPLDPSTLVRVDGLTVVPAAIAAVHAACDLPEAWGLAACDFVLYQRLATVADLRAALDALSSLPRHAHAVRPVLLSRWGAQTPLESLSRHVFRAHGMPEPQLQVPVFDGGGLVGIVDFLFAEWGVIGEADGRIKYGTGDVVVAEKLREDRLRALGFEVVRWTWDEIMSRPEDVLSRIVAAARRSRRRSGPEGF